MRLSPLVTNLILLPIYLAAIVGVLIAIGHEIGGLGKVRRERARPGMVVLSFGRQRRRRHSVGGVLFLISSGLTLLVLLGFVAASHAGTPEPPHLIPPAVYTIDHSHRYVVAQRLLSGLAGTPLAGYAWVFESEGHRWNVNPFLVASISGTESSFGAAACGGNAWGINSCATSFASFADGIRYTTRLLRTFYLDRGYTTLLSVGGRYAACGACWAGHTSWFMRNRFKSDETLTYPR